MTVDANLGDANLSSQWAPADVPTGFSTSGTGETGANGSAGLRRHSPLEDWADRFEALAPAVTIVERPFLTQLTLWVDPDRVTSVLGVRLPGPGMTTRGTTEQGTAERGATEQGTADVGEIDILWMGPDEFLVIGPPDVQATLESSLASAVSEAGGTVVDVSAQRTTLTIGGWHARDIMAHGCSTDLHPNVAPDGTCRQLPLARAGVVLVVNDSAAPEFTVLVRSSFAGYLADWLVDAAAEYRASYR